MVTASFTLATGCQIAPPAATAEPTEVIAGRRIAERDCGMCHSTSAAPSLFNDAPPFRDLHLRYRQGGLEELLREGMLSPDSSMDQRGASVHPRMPTVDMGVDERASLVVYLRSQEPREPARIGR
jgi:mono/diheme cytochrome c family protein